MPPRLSNYSPCYHNWTICHMCTSCCCVSPWQLPLVLCLQLLSSLNIHVVIVGTRSIHLKDRKLYVCVCMRVCVCACVYTCVRACVCVCVCMCMHMRVILYAGVTAWLMTHTYNWEVIARTWTGHTYYWESMMCRMSIQLHTYILWIWRVSSDSSVVDHELLSL